MRPLTLIGGVWLAWLVSWLLAALWRAEAVSRPATSREIVYRVLTTAGGTFLFGGFEPITHGGRPLWHPSTGTVWSLLGVVLVGLGLTWWARLHLGRLWSSSVTRKADHVVVDSGPYALVRHPIYTGILVAAVATAVARGTVDAVFGTGVLTLGFYVKARLEESFLRAELGPPYDAYARRVGMLVPFTGGRSR